MLRKILSSIVFPIALILTTMATVIADNYKCDELAGPFTSTLNNGPGCSSPIQICTTGDLTGGLTGNYDFTMLTLGPSGNPADPNEFVYTGTSVITDLNGDRIFGQDSGVMHVDPAGGDSPFTTTVTFLGGTGKYAGAVGRVVATGVLNFTTGQAAGNYTAVVCSRKRHS